MSRADILKRIRKCMALANSANENEAAAAIAKARELMDAHGLTEAEVDLADIETAAAGRSRARRPARWETRLINLISGTFGVGVYLDWDHTVRFVGVGPSAEIATYAFSTVHRLLTRHRRDFILTKLKRCKVATKRVRADHFCEGWVRGLELNIICIVPEARECPRAEQWIAENIGTQTISARPPGATRSRSTSDDFWAGYDQGKEVNLHHGLKGEATVTPLALGTS